MGHAGRGPACALCGAATDKKQLDGIMREGQQPRDIYFCPRCSIGITRPLPSAEELAALYRAGSYRSEAGGRFNPLVEKAVHLFRLSRARRIETLIKAGRLFDIGCGRGLFLRVMQQRGWKVLGAEADPETAASLSSLYGIEVLSGESETWRLGQGSFDVITLFHVLEHLADPAAMLRTCRGLLRTGGLLVIAVPNLASLQAAFGGREWFHLDVPYHLHHFTKEGLLKFLAGHSFRPVKVRHFDLEQNPFGWLQTLLNRSGAGFNLLYSLLKNRELRQREIYLARRAKPWQLFLTLALTPLYLPLAFVLSVVEALLGRGGTIEVYAIKE